MALLFKKKQLKALFLFLFVGIGVALSISYFISIKIHNSFFRSVNSKNIDFIKSYDHFNINYNSKQIKIYTSHHPSNPIYILYIPSKYGALNDVVTAISSKYSFYGFEYPVEKKYQNFSSIKNLTRLTIETMKKVGIKPESIILFGHGIGANIAFEVSLEENFLAILGLNPLLDEKSYCKLSFFKGLCLTIRPSFKFHKYNKNVFYYFFNKNEFFALDENYDIFNLIKARDKFLFEIPGEDLNFNFNHILDFYQNEGKVQLELYETKSLMDTDSAIIDVDGYTDPDTYFD